MRIGQEMGPRLRGDDEHLEHAVTFEFPDLDAALTEAGLLAAFAALPPSNRTEYTRWIAEAKRPDTRARRIAGTVQRLQAKTSA